MFTRKLVSKATRLSVRQKRNTANDDVRAE